MSTARILIIEDDATLNEQITCLLKEQGFTTSQCFDGQQGLLTALRGSFDLILLDILLPSLNGLSLLSQLRQVTHTPVMMITASGAEQQRIEGYRCGADDYLSKPFNFTEMMLRIGALLRRTQAKTKPLNQPNQLISEELRLDRTQQQVYFANNEIELTPIQFKLLWVLLENTGNVLNKAVLYQLVLDRPYSRYDRSLDMHLSRVRKKLVESGMCPQRLTTVHGKGYRFL